MAARRARAPDRAAGIRRFEQGIKKVSEIRDPVKILVYARNGMGKTRFAATAPDVLIIDINEKGTRSAAETDARVRRISTWEDVGFAYWFLRGGNHEFKSVAIDTVTAMQAVCMNFVLGEAEDRDPTREKKSPDKRAYGRVGTLMREQLLAFRNLPMHVIFLAQERVEKDEETGEPVLHTAQLSAASRGAALDYCGIIGRMYSREVKKRQWEDRMLVGPHEEYDTKDRSNNLGTIVRNPTMPDIIRAWNSRKEK